MGKLPNQALSIQFYDWEWRGGGGIIYPFRLNLSQYSCRFGITTSRLTLLTMGLRPSLWQSIGALFTDGEKSTTQPEHDPPEIAIPYTDRSPLCIYLVVLPRQFTHRGGRMEQLLVLCSYLQLPVSFEIIGSHDEITIQIVCREMDADYFLNQCKAFFPECSIVETENDKIEALIRTELPVYTVDFGLAEEFMRPIATYTSLDFDPYTPLYGVLETLHFDQYAAIQILFTGTRNAWAESILSAVSVRHGKESFFIDAPEMPQLAKEKTAKPLYAVTIRAITKSPDITEAGVLLQHIAIALINSSTSPTNALVPLSDESYTLVCDCQICCFEKRTGSACCSMLLN